MAFTAQFDTQLEQRLCQRAAGSGRRTSEVYGRRARRIHSDAATDVLGRVRRGGLELMATAEGRPTKVLRGSERFARQPVDLADATIAAARLKPRHPTSIDADFELDHGVPGRPPINLLRS